MKHLNHYTLITITYNHDKSILRHLKSIITQIKYHRPKSVHLIIIDDFSIDNTPQILNEWVKVNSHYFNKVELQLNSKNIGMKANYLNAMRNNKNPYYKLLAGDDAYVGNIFEFIDYAANFDVVFSPIITSIFKKFYIKDYLFIKLLNGINNEIITNLIYGKNVFSAPGGYVHPSLFDSGLSNYLEYSLDSYHEDLPSWLYLFVISKISFVTYPSPICIYYPKDNKYDSLKYLIKYILSSSKLLTGYILNGRKYNTTPKNLKYFLKNINQL